MGLGGLLSVVGNAGVQGFKAQGANIDEAIKAQKEAALEKRKENLLAIAHRYNMENTRLAGTLATTRETKLEALRAKNARKTNALNVKAMARLPVEKIKEGAKLFSDVFGLSIEEATKLWTQKDKTGDINKVIDLTEEVRKLEEDGDIPGANNLLERGASEGIELGWRLAVVKDKKGNRHIKAVTVSQYRKLNAPAPVPPPTPGSGDNNGGSSLQHYLKRLSHGASGSWDGGNNGSPLLLPGSANGSLFPSRTPSM